MNGAKRAVLLSSGGLDSTTTMAIALSEGYELFSLSFRYGQRHELELEAAERVAKNVPKAIYLSRVNPVK